MSQTQLLIVEDEAPIRDMVRFALQRAGYRILEASDAGEARKIIAEQHPDLILMDWMLPGRSGLDLVRELKRDNRTRNIPVIMLTARTEEPDKVRGFDVGADDFVTKPFSPRELAARIRAVLRRARPEKSDQVVEAGDLCLDPESHHITVDGTSIDLGPTEFRLLHFFMTHPERVYSRGQILDYVWGHSAYIEERTVDVHIRRLRKALALYSQEHLIQTIRGTGYRLSVRE